MKKIITRIQFQTYIGYAPLRFVIFLIKRIFPVSYYFQNVGRHFTRLLKKYLRSKRITGAAKKLETGTIRLAIDQKHILKIMRTMTQISSLPLQITQKVNMTVGTFYSESTQFLVIHSLSGQIFFQLSEMVQFTKKVTVNLFLKVLQGSVPI